MTQQKIKTYILDDEPLAVEGVKTFLEFSFPGYFEVIGENLSPDVALNEINDLKPELLFIDIEMPGMTGFEVIRRLRHKKIKIIFVTAYDEFAIKAFEIDALDYLLKPLNPDRFQKTLCRVIKSMETVSGHEIAPCEPKVLSKLKDTDTEEKNRVGILAKEGYRLVPIEEIKYVQADNNYTEFYLTTGKKLVHSKNLKSVEDLLPSSKFIRISRSEIVRTAYIEVFNPTDGGFIVLKDASKHAIGYTYKKMLKEFMKNKFLV